MAAPSPRNRGSVSAVPMLEQAAKHDTSPPRTPIHFILRTINKRLNNTKACQVRRKNLEILDVFFVSRKRTPRFAADAGALITEDPCHSHGLQWGFRFVLARAIRRPIGLYSLGPPAKPAYARRLKARNIKNPALDQRHDKVSLAFAFRGLPVLAFSQPFDYSHVADSRAKGQARSRVPVDGPVNHQGQRPALSPAAQASAKRPNPAEPHNDQR